jgi:uroporphyrinogen III methyltransferase / synthase
MLLEKPLSNKTILVTRAKRAEDELVTQLENYGAKVLYSPTIEIVDPEDYSPLDEALSNLSRYDWVIFTSRNAVERVLSRMEKLNLELSNLSKLKILVVGLATSRALEKAQIFPVLIPKTFSAEGALDSLQKYYQNNDLLSKCNFLFPRAEIGRDILPVELAKIGAKVDLVTAYKTSIPNDAKRDLLSIFHREKIDLITFTSPSTINNLAELVAPESLRDLLNEIAIACIGPVTVKAVKEFGLKINVCPNQSTSSDLVIAIKDYFLG